MGFLTSAEGERLEDALPRVFAGEFRIVELCTLAAALAEGDQVAVNDVVATSAQPGRMVELGWEVGGEELGSQPCDGLICCTPSGSTAYNLSNGGPVMMWGLEAMAITFVAPHSLHARPLVLPRGHDLIVTNRSPTSTSPSSWTETDGRRPRARWLASPSRSAGRPRRSPSCPRSASSPATTRSSRRRPLLRSLRIENFVLIREAELGLRPGPERGHRRERAPGRRSSRRPSASSSARPATPATSGPGAAEAYVEADFDLPAGILEDETLETLAELRPEDEDGLVAARRVFADGRTRAYAWGRAVPREELAALVERLLAMSGQFEQRRLARPSFQLDVLDAFVGEEHIRRRAEHARAWRELGAARRRRDELASAEAGRAERLEELRQLVERTQGFAPETEDALRSERERLRHVTELAEAATEAAERSPPSTARPALSTSREGRGRADAGDEPRSRAADGVRQPRRRRAADSSEVASALRGFLASLEAEPGRLEEVEGELERIADARRRFGAASYEELLARAEAARRGARGA